MHYFVDNFYRHFMWRHKNYAMRETHFSQLNAHTLSTYLRIYCTFAEKKTIYTTRAENTHQRHQHETRKTFFNYDGHGGKLTELVWLLVRPNFGKLSKPNESESDFDIETKRETLSSGPIGKRKTNQLRENYLLIFSQNKCRSLWDKFNKYSMRVEVLTISLCLN